MTNRLRIPAIALLAASTMLLAGCTFRVTDPNSDTVPKDRPSPSAEQSAPDDTDTDTDTDIDSVGTSADRAAYLESMTVTLTCDGELEVDQPGSTVRVEGPCDTLIVSGDASVVVADDVTSLQVTAAGSVVYALEVETIIISGDVNTVFWTGSTPSTDDTGTANTLAKDAS